ncbi:hypothetical protein [Herbiconiux sp. L3-i23]|uniref:hypothetical protein n=1 Tax=Herbiconiux sp. L3-i23 TaxID=2905871 RepID=UPI00206D0367|nr:hypothetical protein [Herbiconiux sp. L3-i23]BDI23503.1 hypothetical protein L3i23_22790 [Herbiconiux sp. L3-i23]
MSTLALSRVRIRRSVAAGAVALALTGALAGCSGTPLDNIVGGAVDRAIEEAVGGDVDISTDGQVPDGFPESIPLVDGTVVGGAAGGGAGWTVVIQPDSVDRFAEAQTALEGAGFTANASNADADSAFGSFTGTNYNLQLTFSTDAEGVVTAVYVVTPA